MRSIAPAALLALTLPVATALAQPLVVRLVDSEYAISRLVQTSPDATPIVRSRGGIGGGSASYNDDATAMSFGDFFPTDFSTHERQNVITADMTAHAGFGPTQTLSASCVAYRYAWIELHRSIRYRITGTISSELSLGEGDWGSSRVYVELAEGAQLITRAEANANEGEEDVMIEGVINVNPTFGSDWYFITFEVSANLTSSNVADHGARANADITIELLPMGCTVADLAPPFGQLDAADVLEFVEAWSDREPIADYAAPYNEWDVRDVLAFLEKFGEGCPEP
ncbi:MAG: GC-type dockerin domain-anchored protein [Phycisphaerales bacterium]